MRNTLLLALAGVMQSQAQQYTREGNLLRPKDYRQWIFLASGYGMGYPIEGQPMAKPTFTNIFVQPSAIRGFEKTGLWPDKTVLLMEVRDAGNDPSVNKDSRFQTNLMGLEAHVKDASRSGWTFYFIPKDGESGKPFAKDAKCYSCHEKDAATDTTFVQYYPTLIEIARKHGTYKEPKQ